MSLTALLTATLKLLASILDEKKEEYAASPYIVTDIDKNEESKKK